MENPMTARPTDKHVHRIGTITFGCTLIVFGVLFLMHMIVPVLSYDFIFRLWPCIFIFLGIEVLIGNFKEGVTFIYDKTAVFLLVLLSLFTMVMAFVDFYMQAYANYINY